MACFYGLRKLGAPLRVFRVRSSCWYSGLKASLIEIGRVDFTNKHLHTLSISVIYAYVKAIFTHFTPPSAVRAGRAYRSKDSTRRSYVQKVPSLFGSQEIHLCHEVISCVKTLLVQPG